MEKRAKIILLSLLSFLFLICLFWGGRQFRTVNVHMVQDASMETAAAAEIRTEDSSIKINAFQSDNGDSYIFLPSCAEGKRLAVDGGDVPISCRTVESGLSIAYGQGHTLTILTGSEIPSVFLTLKHDISYIGSDKSLSDSGQAVFLNADGETVYTGGLERIKGRGNTSWEQEKKPYNIVLKNAVSLPETGYAASEFALVSSSDISFLRNRISNGMAEAMGGSYVEGICIHLYINDTFQGVYEMYPKINPESLGIWDLAAETELVNRCRPLPAQSTTGVRLDDWNQSLTGKWWDYENNPENVTGGYLLEIDHAARYENEPSGFILDSGAYVVSKSPSRLSEAQYQYISGYMQECENAMISGVGKDSVEELSQYIDISSFIAKYLVEEVSKNIDCSSTSQYFYKDKDGILYAGPVWDYDWAYGVERIQEGIDYLDPEGFSAREIPGTLKWWQLLYYNNAVYQNMVGTYEKTLYPYLNRITQSELSNWAEELVQSAVMDYCRWGRCDLSDLSEVEDFYYGQVAAVKDFLLARKEFLYREWVVGGDDF